MREHFLLPDEPFQSYEAYRAAVGGDALAKARGTAPDALLKEIGLSGLRGRGGAGFHTGTKWSTVRNQPAASRVIVCNAAEGEPGTFKDRWLIRYNPYAVLEGMLVAAHVVGAKALYIGIKAAFARERVRLDEAIQELDAAGVLGGCNFTIVPGPDEYLFGEEKALVEVIAGGGPLPREPHYPPYELGPFGTQANPEPAVVNNTETFAHVPSIVRAGAASFRQLGTVDTPGTVLFTVSGDVQRPGIYEREAGLTLRKLFEEAGGGARPGRRFKAALAGVSSAVIPESRFDTVADFGSLQLIRAGLGSAGFVVLDDERSIPRVAQSVARFLYIESCNQCTACKHGLRVSSHSLDDLFDADRATPDAMPRALFGARSAPQQNRCYLPVQGSVLIPSLVQRFEAEFEDQLAHPRRPSEPFLIPKMVDYDAAAHAFVYDERQARKRPDWTFEPPVVPPESRFAPASAPLDADRAPVTVRLAPDVARALSAVFDGAQLPLDEQVNEALRDWLRRR